MTPLNPSTTVSWQNVCLDGGDYINEYHSIFRDGSYALMFSHFYERAKSVCVTNLDNGRVIKTYKFDLNESILNFRFPYLVSKTRDNLIRIWDLNSNSTGPVNTIDKNLRGIHGGVIHENTVYIFSTQQVSMVPKYLTILGDIEKPDEFVSFGPQPMAGVDLDTGLLMHEGNLIFSMYFGSVVLMVKGTEQESKTLKGVKDVKAFQEGLNDETIAKESTITKYENNIVRYFVAEGNTLVGATVKAIKIWDLNAEDLQREFPTEEPCQLFSLQGKFLFGTSVKFNPSRTDIVNIWDIVSGNVLFSMDNTSSHPIPHCVMYNNKFFHVNAKTSKMPDTVVHVPLIEQAKPNKTEPPSTTDKDERCDIM